MKKRILAILEPKEEYARLFLSFLQERKDVLFDTRVFTKEEALEGFLQEETLEILLISERCDYRKYEKEAELCILLSEGTFAREEKDRPMIYKFQSADQILREVYEIYVDTQTESAFSYLPKQTRSCKQYSVFSPYGGSGKTTLSMVLGNILGERKKVLVVCLEPFYRHYPWLDEERKQGVSTLLYYVKQDRKDVELKVKALVSKAGNVDYLFGVSHYEDLQNCQEKDIEAFMAALQMYTQYEVIIYDVGFMSRGLWCILEHCDRIYEPVRLQGKSDWLQSVSVEQEKRISQKLIQVMMTQQIPTYSLPLLCQGDWGAKVRRMLEEEEDYEGSTSEEGFRRNQFVYGNHR